MALDTSIFAQYLRPVKSIADYDAEYQDQQRNALLLDQARQQQASAAQKMQMDREAAMRAEQGRNALMAGLKTADLRSEAGRAAFVQETGPYGADFLKEYSVSAENFGKADKSTADAVKTRGEALDKALSRNRDLLNFVQTPQQAAQWAAAAYQDPDLAPIMQRIAPDPEAFARGIPQDPKSFADWRVAGVSSVDKLRDLVRQEMAQAETARHNKAGEQIQTRGQDLTNQRAREGLALQRERFKYEQGRDAVADKERAAGAGPAGPAAKPLTEGQAKALQFATRMESSNKLIAELEKEGRKASTPGSRAGYGVGAVVNAFDSEKGQRLNQSKRDFINAILRRESGAVISDQEFDNAEKQYFPQIGDKPGTIEQKAKNRTIAIEGMKADVPAPYQGEFSRISGSAPSAEKATPAGLTPEEQRELQELRKRFGK